MDKQSAASNVTEVDYDPFASAPIERVAPTTEAQREVWLASELSQQASLAYNESSTFDIRGPLDTAALTLALQTLVQRHDALRTTFDGEGLQLIVQTDGATALPLVALDGLDEALRASRLTQALASEVETAFDLQQGPLLRTKLIRLAPEHHLLLLTAHHIVCDGWSLSVIARELGALYAAQVTGAPSTLAPAPSYAEHALRLASGVDQAAIEADARYWLAQFAQGAPTLDLPTDRPRPGSRGFASLREDVWLDAALLAEVKRFSGRHGRSLFSTLLATFASLIARISGQDDVVVGVPAAGQLAVGETGLVGHCVNLLPVRFTHPAETNTEQFLGHAHTQLLDAFDHQRCTFGTLLQRLQTPRDPSRLPLVNVMFNVDQSLDSKALGFGPLEVRVDNNPRHFENFELFVNACQVDGALRLECQYNTGLFDAVTIRQWMACYQTLIEGVLRDTSVPLHQLNAVPQAQLDLLRSWNDTPGDAPQDVCVHELIAAQASRTPTAIALIADGQPSTYGALHGRVQQLAQALRQRGIGRGQLVGLCVQRSTDMVVAQLAILQSGAAYVPLDPAFPPERLAYMAEDAKLSLLVTETALRNTVAWPDSHTLLLDGLAPHTHGDFGTPPPNSALDARPEDPAYVIYTSGSTGKPKGVIVPHGAVVNFLHSMAREPGLAPQDRLVAVTTLSFDIAVLELLLPLTVGASVVLAKREQVVDGVALRALVEASDATVMQATPTSWRLLIDAGWQGGPHFKALVGGESLPQDLAAQLLSRTGKRWNMYGPTETTVWSTCGEVTRSPEGISIGTPIDNTQVHILDAHQGLCPIGVAGEIYIGGAGVTTGYLGRPDLTADRFLDVAIAGAAPTRVYRTGDSGRWRHSGRLEHLGRLDAQVKVRGYRIELGEIESVIGSHPQVARVVVIVREDQPGDHRLVAYVVQRGGPIDAHDLRRHMRVSLPEYMVAQHIVVLDDIPLLPNGKINRNALPAPGAEHTDAAAPGSLTAPRNETERMVAECMAAVLKLDAVDVRANFFEMGGHSLLAAQLMSRIGERLGRRLGLATLFAAPTVEALALQYTDAGTANATSGAAVPEAPIPHLAEQGRAPLSPMQMRMWFIEQLNPDTNVHNVPSGHRLRGPLDRALFQQAVTKLIERQAALRTVVIESNGQYWQEVRDALPGDVLPFEDLSGLAADVKDKTLSQRFEELGAIRLRANEAPLVRMHLFRLAPDEHIFFFMAHHIIWDGISFDVLYNDLSELYAAAHEGRPHRLAPISVTYADYAAWQSERMAGPEGQRQTQYWKESLTPLPAPLAMTLDKPRPAVLDDQGSTHQVKLPPALTEQLMSVTRQRGATVFAALLAAVGVLLNRHTGQESFVIGTPVWGREKAGLEALMGLFINVLPVRLDVSPQDSFGDLMQQARDRLLTGMTCPDVPFEQMIQAINPPRDLSRTPVYQVMMSYQDVRQRPVDWGPLKHSRAVQQVKASAQDLGLWCALTHETLEIQFRYNTNLFRADSIAALSEDLLHVLAQGLAQHAGPVGEIASLGTEQQQRLSTWNETTRPFPRQATIATLLADQAGRSPQATALVLANGERLSYAELDHSSNQLARLLRQRGISRGHLVGLATQRGLHMLVAQHAILKAGAAYVPLDPAYPTDRVAHMVEDAALPLVITDADTAQRLDLPHDKVLLVEALPAMLGDFSDGPLAPEAELDARPADPAYVIYTSGSTGKPKGVVVPHGAVVNFLCSMAREPGMGAADRLLAVTTLSFDIAVLELLLPLTQGATVVLAEREHTIDGQALMGLLAQHQCTVMQATPSTWRMLIDAGWQGSTGFKALVGGEALTQDLADALMARTGELWNMYGPTETTVWSTCWRVQPGERPISIGRPIDNTQVHVLDAQMRPCPIGVPGELWIGGDGVTLGYLHRPELTAERFLADPFSPQEGARLYRTGDRGRWAADGLLEHLGRLDFQVKVRGHRIELGEIEVALLSHPALSRAVVIVREDQPGDQRLVAYVVAAQPQQAPTSAAVREHLKLSLPDYMLPQHLVALDAIPLLPNGKVNRHALPAPVDAQDHADEASADALYQTDAQRQLARIWRQLLGVSHVRPEDNFFDLGGHSLLSLTAISMMEKVTGVRVNPRRYILESFAQIAASAEPSAQEPTVAAVSNKQANVPLPQQPMATVEPNGSTTASAPGLLGRLFGRKRT